MKNSVISQAEARIFKCVPTLQPLPTCETLWDCSGVTGIFLCGETRHLCALPSVCLERIHPCV